MKTKRKYRFPSNTTTCSFSVLSKKALFLVPDITFDGSYQYAPEKAMAPHSSALAWKIPWMEEPGRLQSMGLLRVGHDWATSLSRIGEGNGNPLQCSCLENPRDGGTWWTAVYGVAQSWTRLKGLSSSSSISMPCHSDDIGEGDGVLGVAIRSASCSVIKSS